MDNNLKAFKSGIGNGNDLLVTKSSSNDFYENFNLYANIFGYHNVSKRVFPKITFDYRMHITGTQSHLERSGFLKFQVKAYPINTLTYTVTKTAIFPMQINWHIRIYVQYYKFVSTDNYILSQKIISTPLYNYNFTDPIDINNKVQVSNDTIENICAPIIEADTDISSSISYGLPYYITRYEIRDDYHFDLNNQYNVNASRLLDIGDIGSVKTVANMNGDFIDGASHVYTYGYCDPVYYTGSRQVTNTYTADMGTINFITQSDLTVGGLIFNQYGNNIGEDDPSVVTHISLDFVDEDICFNSPIDTTKTNVLVGTINSYYETPEDNPVVYTYAVDNPQANIVFNNLMDLNENQKYKFIVNISDFSLSGTDNNISNIQITAQDNSTINLTRDITNVVYNNVISDYQTSTAAFLRDVSTVNNFEITYPDNSVDPWHGEVNGNFTDNNNGKQDLEIHLPTIQVPPGIDGLTYRVSIENISPVDAFIDTRFNNEIKQGVTTLNGDIMTVKSSYLNIANVSVKQLIETQIFDSLYIDTLNNTITVPTNITKPTDGSITYTSYELDVSRDNPNIQICDYNPVLNFTDNQCTSNIIIKGDNSAIAHWNPKIHNGTYYINQHEYYLPTSEEITGDVTISNNNIYKTDITNFIVNLHMTKHTGTTQNIDLVLQDVWDFLNNPTLANQFDFDVDNKLLYCKPTINAKYYKQYSNLDYISDPISLEDIASSYGNITFATNTPGASAISFYVRAYNETTSLWDNWQLITSGNTPTITLSDTIQFKISFVNDVQYVVKNNGENVSSASDYLSEMDPNKSQNIFLNNNRIETEFNDAPGTFISNTLDYGINDTNFIIDIHKSPNAKVYISTSNYKDNINYIDIDTVEITSFKGRYLKYKVVVNPNDYVYQIYRYITCSVPSVINLPTFSNLNINYSISSTTYTDTYTKNYNIPILFDTHIHTLVSNLWNDVSAEIQGLGYNNTHVDYIGITNGDANEIADIIYDSTDINTSISAASKIEEYTIFNIDRYLNFTNHSAVIYPKPQQFSAICIDDETNGLLQQVYFYDSNNNPVIYNTEDFIYNGIVYLLQFNNIDINTFVLTLDDSTVINNTRYTINGNELTITDSTLLNTHINIKYSLVNSFVVDYNYNDTGIRITVNTTEPTLNTSISYETNILDNKMSLLNISLNPIFNYFNEGFIYLTDVENTPDTININTGNNTILSNGKDIAFIYVQVLGKNNPVPKQNLTVTISNQETGDIINANNLLTDDNGIITFEYTTTNIKTSNIIVSIPSLSISNSINIISK